MKMTNRIRAALFAVCFSAAGTGALATDVRAAGITSESEAVAKAQAKVPGATVTEADRDHENGVVVYDVELVKGNKKFEITWRASDARIISYGWEKISVGAGRNKPVISESRCRSLAQNKVKKGTILSISRKYDDGVEYYKVKMSDADKIYKLKFHARTGALIEYEWKYTVMPGNGGNSGNSGNNGNNASGYIGLNKAKQIALGKVPDAVIVKAEFDMDDGVPVYEIELVKGRYEYEAKIHAETGSILEWEQDYND